jgi:transposase
VDDLKEKAERRRWSKSAKRRIIGEALAPGARAADIALKYTLNLSQLYTWCRPFRKKLPAIVDGGAIVPIDVVDSTVEATPPPALNMMSISMPSGVRVELDLSVDDLVLRRVIAAMRAAG